MCNNKLFLILFLSVLALSYFSSHQAQITGYQIIPVYQTVTLRNNADTTQVNGLATTIAQTTTQSPSDPEGKINLYSNRPVTFTEAQTGKQFTIQDTCSVTNPQTLVEVFHSKNNQNSVLIGGQWTPLNNIAGAIEILCPGNQNCQPLTGTCTVGPATLVTSNQAYPTTLGSVRLQVQSFAASNSRIAFATNTFNNVPPISFSGETSIYYLDVSNTVFPTATYSTILQTQGNGNEEGLEMDGDNLVFSQITPPGLPQISNIFVYHFPTNTYTNIALSLPQTPFLVLNFNPDIHDRWIVWQRNVAQFIGGLSQSNIFAYDLGPDLIPSTGDDVGPIQITNDGISESPRVSGGVVAWANYPWTNYPTNPNQGQRNIRYAQLSGTPFPPVTVIDYLKNPAFSPGTSSYLNSYAGPKPIDIYGSNIAISRTIMSSNAFATSEIIIKTIGISQGSSQPIYTLTRDRPVILHEYNLGRVIWEDTFSQPPVLRVWNDATLSSSTLDNSCIIAERFPNSPFYLPVDIVNVPGVSNPIVYYKNSDPMLPTNPLYNLIYQRELMFC